MFRKRIQWFIIGAADILLQFFLLAWVSPYRLTHPSIQEVLCALLSLSWVFLIPKIRRSTVRLFCNLIWVGGAALLRSQSMMILFLSVLALDAAIVLGRRETGSKTETALSTSVILGGLGLAYWCASICLTTPLFTPDLPLVVLFLCFVMRVGMSSTRILAYPSRMLDCYVTARRGLLLVFAMFGESRLLLSLPMLVIDLVTFILLWRAEFDKNLNRKAKIIYPNDTPEKDDAAITTRVIVSGFSGVGKTAVCRELIDRIPNARQAVTATTRPPRKGEIDGIHYHFKSVPEFEELIHGGKLLEYVQYDGNYYGTPVEEATHTDEIIIHVVEPEGCKRLTEHYPDAVTVFLAAPGDIVEKRLRSRDRHASEESIRARMSTAVEMMSHANEYQYFLVGDYSIADTASQLQRILELASLRTASQKNTIEEITQLIKVRINNYLLRQFLPQEDRIMSIVADSNDIWGVSNKKRLRIYVRFRPTEMEEL